MTPRQVYCRLCCPGLSGDSTGLLEYSRQVPKEGRGLHAPRACLNVYAALGFWGRRCRSITDRCMREGCMQLVYICAEHMSGKEQAWLMQTLRLSNHISVQ